MMKQRGFFDVEERLTQAEAIERLFERFDATMYSAGYLPMSDQILDGRQPMQPPAMAPDYVRFTLALGKERSQTLHLFIRQPKLVAHLQSPCRA